MAAEVWEALMPVVKAALCETGPRLADRGITIAVRTRGAKISLETLLSEGELGRTHHPHVHPALS